MAESSGRFALPYLQPGQAQKEIFHNEALTRIDALLHPVAETAGLDAPPGSPAAGQCWIIGDTPSGAWVGHAGELVAWSEGGWRFAAPSPGMLVWVADQQLWARRESGGWVIGDFPISSLSVDGDQVVGARQAAIADPTGGATVDTEARTALASLLAAARAHGLIAT
jgi:hypothetical protein